MSNIDPFGTSNGSYGGYRRGKSAPGDGRSSGNGFMNGLGQLGGLAQDVGQHIGKKGGIKGFKRGWAQIGIYLAAANLVYGLCVVAWSFISMRNHLSGGFAFVLGVAMALVGVAGLFTSRKEAYSLKTLYVFATFVCGLLSCMFMIQTGYATRQDCVLAETFLRLDHLEDALHRVRHEEMINGLLMRMDHLSVELQQAKEHAEDTVGEAQKRQEFKHQDAQYVDAKLMQLVALADRSLQGLEEKIAQYEGNITALQQPGAEQEQDITSAQLKARIRSLQYRQRTLAPRKDALREMLDKLDEHRSSGDIVTMEEYEQMIRTLETNTAQLDADLRDEVRAEKQDVPYVKASSERLATGDYSQMAVGDYAQKQEERTARANAQRTQYEEYMARVTKERATHVTSKEKYIRSLNQYLENMPEHCMQDLSEMLPGQVVGLMSMALVGATGYVALTSTVMAVKKDY